MPKSGSWESQLAVLFGFPLEHAPLAAVRSLGNGMSPHGLQLCADPVNLDFMQQALVLSPIPAACLSEDDTAALVQSLNDEFAGEGHFEATTSDWGSCQWTYIVQNPQTMPPDLAACSRLAGRRVDADETRLHLGRDGLRWLNRIQMCLSQHPVNMARAEIGLPLINSLWPWGLGELSQHPPNRFTGVSGQSTMLSGLCKLTNTPCMNHAHFSAQPGEYLATELRLTDAICQSDLAGWQKAMVEMVEHWVTPALAALNDRQHPLQSLTLISPNAHHEHRWVLRRGQMKPGTLLQRWLGIHRKTPSLHALIQSWSA